jgi:hypothetical protein
MVRLEDISIPTIIPQQVFKANHIIMWKVHPKFWHVIMVKLHEFPTILGPMLFTMWW